MSIASVDTCLNSDFMLVPANPLAKKLILNHRDADGTRWVLNDIDGWWGLPPSSIMDIPRPQKQDGSYDVEGNYLARIVTITGQILPAAKILVPQKRAHLMRVLDTVRGGPLQIIAREHPLDYQGLPIEIDLMAYARLADQPKVSTTKASGLTDFQIALKCVDPRKYSLLERRAADMAIFERLTDGRGYSLVFDRWYSSEAESAGQLNATNVGTVPSAPLIELHGPMTSPLIQNFTTSQELSFPGLALVDGETLYIDVQEHSAVSGGAQRVSYLANNSEWWWLQPGQNAVRLHAASGTGTMTFSWRSAWME
jgi:hypothetical protein